MTRATPAVGRTSAAVHAAITERYDTLIEDSPEPAVHCNGATCWGAHSVGACFCGCAPCRLAISLLFQAEDDVSVAGVL